MAPSASPDQAPDGTQLLFLREIDRLDRRMDQTDARITRMDEQGTRGVAALQRDVLQLGNDLREHEAMHADLARQQVAARRWLIGVLVALVTPLYPLIMAAVWGR